VTVDLGFDSATDAYVGTVELRAERCGNGAGRVYSVACEVTDSSGNIGAASCVVVVPHDRRKR
jgi:hypothetical protein